MSLSTYEIQSIHYQERAGAFYNSFQLVLILNLLIIGLFAVYMAGKDRESEFEQLVITYKVKNVKWIVGKWLVAQLYGLCITIITLVVQAVWFASGIFTFEDLAKNIFYVFVQMEGALFLLISIGFCRCLDKKYVCIYLYSSYFSPIFRSAI